MVKMSSFFRRDAMARHLSSKQSLRKSEKKAFWRSMLIFTPLLPKKSLSKSTPRPCPAHSENPLKEFWIRWRDSFRNWYPNLTQEVLSPIGERGGGHPYYTQLLCHILWDECLDKKEINAKDIDQALDKMLERERQVYETILDGLTQTQKNLLLALSSEPKAQIFSNEFLSRFHLGSASSVQRAFQGLIEKDILDKENDHVAFQDPFFPLWLQKRR